MQCGFFFADGAAVHTVDASDVVDDVAAADAVTVPIGDAADAATAAGEEARS